MALAALMLGLFCRCAPEPPTEPPRAATRPSSSPNPASPGHSRKTIALHSCVYLFVLIYIHHASSLSRTLSELGANIRTARLRRRLSIVQVAERAGITADVSTP